MFEVAGFAFTADRRLFPRRKFIVFSSHSLRLSASQAWPALYSSLWTFPLDLLKHRREILLFFVEGFLLFERLFFLGAKAIGERKTMRSGGGSGVNAREIDDKSIIQFEIFPAVTNPMETFW